MAILTFHNITNGVTPGIDFYSPKRFSSLIGKLKEGGYRFISLDDYVRTGPEDKAISLTFDDGLESFYTYAFSFCREAGIPVTVFVPCGFVGKINRWDYAGFLRRTHHLTGTQIRGISDAGMEIGSHGLTHTSLVGLTNRLMRLELERSKKGLEDITGREIRYISYPFGRFNEKVEKLALEIGYSRGFSLSYFRLSRSGFTLPRFAVYAIDTPYSVAMKLGSGPMGYLEKVKGAIINSYSFGTVFLNRFRLRSPRIPD